jgi:MFS family permease
VLIQATQTAVIFILSVLARKQFAASNTEILIIQAAPTVMFVLSIFWNDLFQRRAPAAYLRLYWLIACLPLSLAAFAQPTGGSGPLASLGVWMLIIPHLISSVGASGHLPVAGELLKKLYPDKTRGRVYAIVFGSAMAFGALACFGVGEWLVVDPDAFRIYMPIAALLQLAGVAVFWRLSQLPQVKAAALQRFSDGAERRQNLSDESRLRRTLDPILHMGSVLKADPTFARYEGAYMTYGIGWMIAYALLPLIVTDKLKLPYDQVAQSTQVPYQIAIVLMLVPAGMLMDRLGAIRSTGLSFAMLALYPVGLILAADSSQLAAVSVWYGIAHAGASVGWMLGPVALAPTPAKVPQYVAIHATLVGLRGAIFQGLGVLLYALTGGFVIPLTIAAIAYIWSSVQMLKLHARVQQQGRAKPGDPAAAAATAPPEEER